MSEQIFQFLSNVMPFNTLPEDKIRSVASTLKIKDYPENKLLFIQGEAVLEYLYIIKKGGAERFFIATDGQEAFSEFLGEKDIYGGGSILFNETVSLLSLRTIERTQFYTLPKDVFLELCEEYIEFHQYIVDSFIQRRVNKNYAKLGVEGSFSKDQEFQYLNQPISNFCSKNPVSCDADMSIQESAILMNQKKCGSVLVKNSKGDLIGIVTDSDLRKKVIAQGYSINRPVSEIMSSPLISINSNAFMFESLVMMMEKNIKHLPVVNDNNNIIGVISNRDLLGSRGSSPFVLIREINQAKTVEEIASSRKQIYPIIQNLVNNGAKPEHLTRIITTVSDTILYKLIQFAIDKIGPAP
ncbi:MAG: CBS domain-containing protein, partial [Desulfobacterales bacterium]|nr:CBS domain-containing protein [Desulfobacterales bacterium]